MDSKKYLVSPPKLLKTCNPSQFKFDSTAEIKFHPEVIGQERALNTCLFGLDIDSPSYNIYLSGHQGSGRNYLANLLVGNKAKERAVPSDWCYVFNFQEPDQPCLLELPPGLGKSLQKDITLQIEKTIKQVIKAFENNVFEDKKTSLINKFTRRTGSIYLKLEEFARTVGFAISNTGNGITSVPLKDGEVLSQDAYANMNDEERSDLRERNIAMQDRINKSLRQYKELEKNLHINIKNLEKETVRQVLAPLFLDLYKKYGFVEQIITYLEGIQNDLLENYDILLKKDDNSTISIFQNLNKRHYLRRYHVNLFIDNSELNNAPVIYESNPNYANLFGQIEYEGEFGILATDFSKIQAGSIHRANGGYIVLNVVDILRNPFVWETLKRVLKHQELKVENVNSMLGISSSAALKLNPMPINIKVVLIGEPTYYHLLYSYDEDFSSLFKLKADFDQEMPRNKENIKAYASIIASKCNAENWTHFSPAAVSEIVGFGGRLAEDQNKLSTQFDKILEIVQEAHSWARNENCELVGREHVIKALKNKRIRASLYEEKYNEAIVNNRIIINTDGERIGEINGLAVYQIGDYAFGKPVRITAKTFLGEKGLINIEREIQLSGQIHSKGILTLAGYLGYQYAQDKPLTLSASLTFEQSYSGIEGDSASSAELYALLSSIADKPINQCIAVTGSVNQNGEIQPVGGINEKIEGYFQVCNARGLNGSHGVIIPAQNVIQLMLPEEIVEAVRKKMFSIWAINHIDEGIEILMDLPAGEKTENGRFSSGSIHYLVNRKLDEWTNIRRSSAGANSLHNSSNWSKRRTF